VEPGADKKSGRQTSAERQLDKCRTAFSFCLILFYAVFLLHMNNEHITTSSIQTKKLGELLAQELSGGEIICLSGDLGAGKTTFTQGLLKGLKIKGPYTSPTFAIAKEYQISNILLQAYPRDKFQNKCKIKNAKLKIFHIDAYRINAKDLLELGFKDFAGKQNSVTIIEWPEKVSKLIPTNALWIDFQWLSEKERKIILSTKKEH
jgi:tRNA threonylcarbamoyladenosine biosynthesis protein TsaE